MRHGLPVCLLMLAVAGSARAHGMLIPEDKQLPPLAMVHHRVNISIQDQVAMTTIEQAFRNHTDRNLEATYIFPIPRGASVNKFTMWVDGKEQEGELLHGKKAAEVYNSIVRRTQDPGLLEYIGNSMMRLKIFPVPPKGVDQKVKISFTSIAPQDNGVVEYVYPLKTDGKATKTLEEFSIKATIKSIHPVQNVYSPTHALNITRNGDKEVSMTFERSQALLDKDFTLFYSIGNKEIGITPLMHKPLTSEDGYFLFLISPQLESSKSNVIPRDLVLVLDTSGSMDAVKMEQARKALKYCLSNLNSQDRFAVVSFSTNVRKYRDTLVEATGEHVDNAKKWVDSLRAGGGTAIQAALDSAIDMRAKDEGRSFVVVFFTDGQPTIGEMKPENILKNVASKNSDNTRIFTFGVGDDVNTAMLDQLAEKTRAVSTYVRPAEDIQTKVTSLYGKISHPVLANVKLTASENIKIYETYPTQMPDLFYGSQLVVLGKYTGRGAAAIKITGQVGKETRDFAYDVTFPDRTTDDRDFVENLWARRKVGFLLDQIRVNGEQKELMDELMVLAKKYGIATPYTSFLVVPDAPMPVVGLPPTNPSQRPVATGPGGPVPPGLYDPGFGGKGGGGGVAPKPAPVADYARRVQGKPEDGGRNRLDMEDKKLAEEEKQLELARNDPKGGKKKDNDAYLDKVKEARGNFRSYEQARLWLNQKDMKNIQGGNSTAVDVAVCSNNLRGQDRLTQTANRYVQGRNCLDVGGVWIDDGYNATMKTVVVKAQSDAYFKILEKNPKMKDVFRLGNHLVYVTPSNVALVIDSNDGKETLDDEEISKLFVAAK
jgi:Ca-activated chloride channel family protein